MLFKREYTLMTGLVRRCRTAVPSIITCPVCLVKF